MYLITVSSYGHSDLILEWFSNVMLMRDDRCGETIAIVATVAAILFPRGNMLVSGSNPIAINFDLLLGPRQQLTAGCYKFAC